MNKRDRLEAAALKAKQSSGYTVDRMLIEFFEDVTKRMQELRMTRAELAERLGISAPAVTRMLGGRTDLKVSTVAKLALALDMVPDLRLRSSFRSAALFRQAARLRFESISLGVGSTNADETDSEFAAAA